MCSVILIVMKERGGGMGREERKRMDTKKLPGSLVGGKRVKEEYITIQGCIEEFEALKIPS